MCVGVIGAFEIRVYFRRTFLSKIKGSNENLFHPNNLSFGQERVLHGLLKALVPITDFNFHFPCLSVCSAVRRRSGVRVQSVPGPAADVPAAQRQSERRGCGSARGGEADGKIQGTEDGKLSVCHSG